MNFYFYLILGLVIILFIYYFRYKIGIQLLKFKNKIYSTYDVLEMENFLTFEECDKIIRLSEPILEESMVFKNNDNEYDKSFRISHQTWLNDYNDPVVKKISLKTSELVKKPVENQELLQVVKYNPGGFFKGHYDPCFGSDCESMEINGGPRLATLIIYLNDDFEGGETYFPIINKIIKPKKGKAVLFYNTDEKGNLIYESFHSGNKITNGVKWICNKWVRINKITN